MRLAGKDKLHRPPQVADKAHEIFEMVEDQRRALVGGEAPGETDRQRVRVEQVVERNEVAWLRAMLLVLQPSPGELDQLAPQPVAQRPKLLVADERPVPHARPKLRLGQFRRPVRRRFRLAKLATPEFSHRPFHPAGQMDAVGHVADRHVVHRSLRIKAVPHLAADPAVQLAHAVGGARRLERQHGHAEFLVVVVRVHAAKRKQFVGADVELPGQMPHCVIH